jgi:hypothetical protein
MIRPPHPCFLMWLEDWINILSTNHRPRTIVWFITLKKWITTFEMSRYLNLPPSFYVVNYFLHQFCEAGVTVDDWTRWNHEAGAGLEKLRGELSRSRTKSSPNEENGQKVWLFVTNHWVKIDDYLKIPRNVLYLLLISDSAIIIHDNLITVPRTASLSLCLIADHEIIADRFTCVSVWLNRVINSLLSSFRFRNFVVCIIILCRLVWFWFRAASAVDRREKYLIQITNRTCPESISWYSLLHQPKLIISSSTFCQRTFWW